MPEPEETRSAEAQEKEPALPASYFQDLLKVPACKRGEPCDNCGRCER